MSEEDIKEMSLEEFELYEKNRMERNAWYATTELTKRIDDAPVLSGYIRAYTSQPKEDLFHFHEPSIILWNSMSSEQNESKIPGSCSTSKIVEFFRLHNRKGELFMDYKKEGCKDISKNLCQFCEKNQSCFPLLDWIPQPVPNFENIGHFMPPPPPPPPLTQGRKDGNTLKDINDYLPRVALRKMFGQNEISLNSQDKIEHFS